jgi:phosphosulfolactate phosphohydrolase-like enzyme
MRIDVALVPAEARRWTNSVCVVVDELRASSMIVTLTGRTAVLASRNGTGVLRSMPGETAVLVGCLLNATAVARAALTRARTEGAHLGIVCAGRRGTFAIDDAIAAGAILDRVLAAAGVDDRDLRTVDGRADPRAPRPRPADAPVLTDAARAALQLWRSTTDVVAGFEASFSGRILAGVGLLEDVAASLPIDASAIVPVVRPGPPPRIERLGH